MIIPAFALVIPTPSPLPILESKFLYHSIPHHSPRWSMITDHKNF